MYQLLGGKTKPRLPVYCTTGRPDIAKQLGFVGAKVTCPHGPAEGDVGLEKNVQFFQKWREAVGPEFPLMLDCYMALTSPYAARLARRLVRGFCLLVCFRLEITVPVGWALNTNG